MGWISLMVMVIVDVDPQSGRDKGKSKRGHIFIFNQIKRGHIHIDFSGKTVRLD